MAKTLTLVRAHYRNTGKTKPLHTKKPKPTGVYHVENGVKAPKSMLGKEKNK